MRRWIALATIGIFMAAAPAAAQTFGFGAHAGVSVPTGSYGGTGADEGFAELGFLGGLDLWYPIMAAPGLSWYTSVDAVAHSTDDAGPYEADGGYIFFPAMTGLRFDIPAGPVQVFATGQIGLVFARPPARTDVSADGKLATEFAFNVGGGVQITDYVYAGAKFYPMGDVGWSWDDGTELSQPANFIDIYVGFGVR